MLSCRVPTAMPPVPHTPRTSPSGSSSACSSMSTASSSSAPASTTSPSRRSIPSSSPISTPASGGRSAHRPRPALHLRLLSPPRREKEPRPMTFGLLVGNRGFFPAHLVTSGREQMIADPRRPRPRRHLPHSRANPLRSRRIPRRRQSLRVAVCLPSRRNRRHHRHPPQFRRRKSRRGDPPPGRLSTSPSWSTPSPTLPARCSSPTAATPSAAR